MKTLGTILKKFFKVVIYFTFLVTSCFCLLEVVYRYQLIDFYKAELEALNPNLNDDYPNGNVLVFGDSFSGFSIGYVEQLRKEYPNTNFINCAISGTGIKQHELFIEQRIKEFKPRKVLYQFYVGNDLLDITRDIKIEHTGFLKASYYFISEHLLILKHLNYKLAGLKSKPKKAKGSIEFLTYNSRVKKQFIANPKYLDETINNKGSQAQKLNSWIKSFNQLDFSSTKGVNILVLPHCAQVNSKYSDKMKGLGAVLGNYIVQIEYPLIERMKGGLKGATILNPLSYLQEKEKEQNLYFFNDPHLNENGQASLAQYLISKGIFDEDYN